MTEQAQHTAQPMIALLPIKELTIDPRYQRALDEKRAQKIADEFRWDLFGVLEVSERPEAGLHAVFDGQHRLSAAMKHGLEAVPCVVHRGLTAEEESVLFTLLQTERKGLSQVDRFKAQLFAQDKETVSIHEIITRYGYRIGKDKGEGTWISAVISLERTFRRFGAAHLDWTISEITSLWNHDPGSTKGKLIVGMAHFLADYGDRYDNEVRIRLTNISPIALVRRAEAVHAGDERAGVSVGREIRKVARVAGRPRSFKKS